MRWSTVCSSKAGARCALASSELLCIREALFARLYGFARILNLVPDVLDKLAHVFNALVKVELLVLFIG
jgi:hypothetical protein